MNTRIQMLFFQHLAMSPKDLTATALNTFEYICVPQILRVRIRNRLQNAGSDLLHRAESNICYRISPRNWEVCQLVRC